MAISFKRNEIIKDTSLKVMNPREIAFPSNSTVPGIIDSVFSIAKDRDKFPSLEELNNAVTLVKKLDPVVAKSIANEMDKQIETLQKQKFPTYINNAIEKLKGMDTLSIGEFVVNAIESSGECYCASTNAIVKVANVESNDNILAGIILAMLLDQLDKILACTTSEELRSKTAKVLMERIVPPVEVVIDRNSAVRTFARLVKSVNQLQEARLTVTTPGSTLIPTKQDLIEIAEDNSLTNSIIISIRTEGVYPQDRGTYLTNIEEALADYSYQDQEHINLLNLRGTVVTAKPISSELERTFLANANAATSLGHFCKTLLNFDISTILTHSLKEEEKTLLPKLEQFKLNLLADVDFISRTKGTGNFDSYDFSSTLPVFTTEEQAYIDSVKEEPDTSRFNDLHPTTETFITHPYRLRMVSGG